MDYEIMLEYHKSSNADITIATMSVPMEEASRFGLVLTDENKQIIEFEEKPTNPKSNLASMGIYIFSWKVLKEALVELSNQKSCDFGKHVIPYCFEKGQKVFAYEYNSYWKDVGTLASYWEANMELIDLIPVFNLYEEFWKIYTKSDTLPPEYIGEEAEVGRSIIGKGSEIYGKVHNSVIGNGVIIEKGAVIKESIIMKNAIIRSGANINKSIIAECVEIGEGAEIGIGEMAESKLDPKVYAFDIATIAENSYIPANVKIGKNTAIQGRTEASDYPNGMLESGDYIIKEGETA